MEDNLPFAVFRRARDSAAFLENVARYVAMEDEDLLRVTEVCLRNLNRIDSDDLAPDAQLRLVLVPELWERLRPNSRDVLRRISSSLAEYQAERSSFRRLLSLESQAKLHEAADCLRADIAHVARLDVEALVEQTRFALAGSRVTDHWSPIDCVYEPGFTYRLVPVIVWRARLRVRQEGSR